MFYFNVRILSRMHTQGHAILNLVFIGEPHRPKRNRWVVLGAVLPYVPIFLFFVYNKFFVHLSEQQIWSKTYFQPGGWQDDEDCAALCDARNAAMLVTGMRHFRH